MNERFKYKGYYGSVEYSIEDKVFFGKILGIHDLILYESKHEEELILAFHEAVEDYLQTCEELGKRPEKTIKENILQ